MTTRREFLTRSAALVAASKVSRVATLRAEAASLQGGRLTLKIDTGRRLASVPRNFTGLSYESAQLGHPEFFDEKNTELIGLFRRLGQRGVLRFGGNTSAFTTWSNDDADARYNRTSASFEPDWKAKPVTIITPKTIRNLNRFLGKTGWSAIYGLNLRYGTPKNAAAEAAFVAEALGSRLLFFQIGNEPDLFCGQDQCWKFEEYWVKWNQYRDAIREAVPGARFGAPDVGVAYDWLVQTAQKKPEIEMLSGHYYASGPPSDPKTTINFLLHRGKDPATDQIPKVHEAVRILGKPFRMTEGNSCYHSGKAGLSDTYASALWAGDYMLQLAQAGSAGVNLHGGGHVPYTPIAGSIAEGFAARPVYYGMLLAGKFQGATLTGAELSEQSASQNVTAFCAEDRGQWKLAILNKAPQAVEIAIEGLPSNLADGRVYLLQAPSIESRTGVTLGGSSVGADGAFHPKPQHQIKMRGGKVILPLASYTAALVILQGS